MIYKEINVEFLINRITSIDEIFKGNYTIDPYQNCEFGCIYCDSSQMSTIIIKKNAPEILKKEIKKIKKGNIIVGSVHDPYQKIEKEQKITRKLLEIILKNNFSCTILTKSDLILRDTDIISQINNCSVVLSICSLKKDISSYFEKNVPLPEIRLKIIQNLKEYGIRAGIAIIPFLPFITMKELENIFKDAKRHNSDFILYKALELKGDQKDLFLKKLKEFDPKYEKKYKYLFKDSFLPNQEYLNMIQCEMEKFSKKYKIKNRI